MRHVTVSPERGAPSRRTRRIERTRLCDKHRRLLRLLSARLSASSAWVIQRAQVFGASNYLDCAVCAREAAAVFNRRIGHTPRPLREGGARAAEHTSVTIEDSARCPRYAARLVEGVKVGPSPAWLRR